MEYQINVTDADIADNNPELYPRCTACPVARAIRRELKQESRVYTADGGHIYVGGIEAFGPPEVFDWIWKFDRHMIATPFSFALMVPHVEHNGFPAMPEPAEAKR